MMNHALKQQHAAGEEVTIIATGPLTNVALMLIAFPDAVALIKEIVLMGGAVGFGNTRPASEFNIEVDPEAAKVVFDSPIPVVMVPLEVTHTALITPDVIESIKQRLSVRRRPAGDDDGKSNVAEAEPTPFCLVVLDLLLFFAKTYHDMFGFTEGPPLHDPCAVFFLLQPDAFHCQDMRVDIETSSTLCYGRTVCDQFGTLAAQAATGKGGLTPKRPTRVALRMNFHAFFSKLIEALERANAISVLNQSQSESSA